MPTTDPPSPTLFARAWRWLKDQIVREVPPEIALCEFDCRKEQCLQGEWEKCERRLSSAAGELIPGPHPGSRNFKDRDGDLK